MLPHPHFGQQPRGAGSSTLARKDRSHHHEAYHSVVEMVTWLRRQKKGDRLAAPTLDGASQPVAPVMLPSEWHSVQEMTCTIQGTSMFQVLIPNESGLDGVSLLYLRSLLNLSSWDRGPYAAELFITPRRGDTQALTQVLAPSQESSVALFNIDEQSHGHGTSRRSVLLLKTKHRMDFKDKHHLKPTKIPASKFSSPANLINTVSVIISSSARISPSSLIQEDMAT